jgi:hypothetical protein
VDAQPVTDSAEFALKESEDDEVGVDDEPVAVGLPADGGEVPVGVVDADDEPLCVRVPTTAPTTIPTTARRTITAITMIFGRCINDRVRWCV